MKKALLATVLVLTACLLTSCAGEPPQNIGVQNGRLTACPESPNCVSSFETDETHGIAPIDANLQQIGQTLSDLPEANIVAADSNYLYAEFTSSLMRYVDDVEFMYDSSAGVTHVRSASRLGYSDMGANRNRIEGIRDSITNP